MLKYIALHPRKRGSYLSAYVLLDLLNVLGAKIRREVPTKFNKFNNTGAWRQDSIYHMTLKSCLVCDFAPKHQDF